MYKRNKHIGVFPACIHSDTHTPLEENKQTHKLFYLHDYSVCLYRTWRYFVSIDSSECSMTITLYRCVNSANVYPHSVQLATFPTLILSSTFGINME